MTLETHQSQPARAIFALGILAAHLPAADLITTDESNIYKFVLTTGAKTVLHTNGSRLFTDVTADGAGGIFVANNVTGSIPGFTSSGATRPGFTTISGPSGYFPEGVAYNPNTNLLTTANSANVSGPARIYATTGRASVSTTAFNMPPKVWSLAYDTSNNLNTIATSLAVISKNGSPLFTLADGTGQFLALETTGIYVSSTNAVNWLVRKYDFAGNPVACFTQVSASTNLVGVMVHDGMLCVTNRNTITKYDPMTGALIQANWATGNPLVSGSAFLRGMTITPNLPVPEPSAYALMTIATGILTAIARRRKAGAGV